MSTSIFSENNQSQKSKRFTLPKCFHLSGLKRSLFPCKSNPNSANRDNYVMFSYDMNTSSRTLTPSQTGSELSIHSPVTSTMIDEPMYSSNQCLSTSNPNYESMISGIDRLSDSTPSTLVVDHMNYHLLQDDMDMEVSRNSFSTTVEFQSSSNENYEDVTILKHNNSPVSAENRFDEILINGNDYCLQSTKLSSCEESTCIQCEISPPRPMPSTSSSSNSRTPKQHSTMLSESVPSGPATSQLNESSICSNPMENHRQQQLESLITSLSMRVEEESERSVREGGVVGSETFVVWGDYDATFVDDISVQFADTVKILRDNNDDWLYVQLSNDGRCGYVPRTIVLDLKQFVKQLKEQQYSFINESH